jgi:tetratricopeptide (TPR) repeat protein
MRIRLLSVFLLPALGLMPALAQDAAPSGATPSGEATSDFLPPKTKAQRLDELFAALKRERNEKAAERTAARIRQEWGRSGSAVVDLMVQWSKEAADKKKFDVALDFLDQVVTLEPAYSEGWNRRATVHFMMHNYSKSMADIEKTLALEPRHFDALSGMARILRETGRKPLAMRAYERVLDIYPMQRNAQNEVGSLSEELTGEAI